jgi:hypothetical protein
VAESPALIQILRSSDFARGGPGNVEGRRRPPDERCEFCGADMPAEHGHVVDLPRRSILCVCRPCYLLFTHGGAGGARFRAVPDRYARLPEFADARPEWEGLDIPIGLAFFFRNSGTNRVHAFYPSPAGATESELALESWEALAHAVPGLAALAPDVEALLVRRTNAGVDAMIAPIDACYELVGRVRLGWRGLNGGDEMWQDVDSFFARAAERAHDEPAPLDAPRAGLDASRRA